MYLIIFNVYMYMFIGLNLRLSRLTKQNFKHFKNKKINLNKNKKI